jgi:hypothetical protein
MWKKITESFDGFPWWMIPIMLLWVFVVVILFFPMPPKVNPVLKDYKDGIQNHLTWSIKGECFFVRPNDDVTVYLVRVPDCDKK